jgi:predicted transcriptional regulator
MTDPRAAVENAPLGILEVGGDGTVTAANDAAATVLGTDREALVGATATERLPRSAGGRLRAAVGEDPSAASFEEYYPALDRWLDVEVVPAGATTLVYLRDCTDRRSDERTVERLRRRLDRVESIDAVVATVLQALVDSSDHEEVARAVCEGLGTTDLYAFAWVGERDPAGGDLRVLASAGDRPALREQIETALAAGRGLPERRAVATGETQSAPSLAADEDLPAAVRRTAFGSGLASSVAVPVAHRDSVYGVIGVYADREDGFSEQERASLETLGAMAGFAITASRRESLLFADTVTELAVEVGDEDTPLVGAAREAGQRLSLTGVVPVEGESVLSYLAVEDPDEVVDALSAREAVATARPVDETDGLVEVRVEGETPAAVLAARGRAVETGEYGPRGARLVAALSPEEDPRRLLATLDRQFADVTVVSKTERPRSPDTAETFRDDLASALTDKQRTALRTAYLSEYFASPRGSSAREVAEALGVTAPTLSYHLRAGQRKLLAAFFEESGDRAPAGDR